MDERYSIRELADKNGFTPDELASRIGVERDEVNAWLAGTVTPSHDQVAKLANEFGVPAEQIDAGATSARS